MSENDGNKFLPSNVDLGEHPFPNFKGLFGSNPFHKEMEIAAGIIVMYCRTKNNDSFDDIPNEQPFNSFFMEYGLPEILVTNKLNGMLYLRNEGYVTAVDGNRYVITAKFTNAIQHLTE